MALRAVPDHPKFADFKMRLRLGKGAALGYLECIWHFTGRFTPQGNIGKYSISAIEAWCEWDGEPGALINALLESHWIDDVPGIGLVVHDWHKHADEATRLSLKRSGLPFIVDTVSPQCHDSVATPSRLPEPEPEPGAEPEPERERIPQTPLALSVAPDPPPSALPEFPPDFQSATLTQAWIRFKQDRGHRALKAYSPIAIETTLAACRGSGLGPDDLAQIIDIAIGSAWNGIPGDYIREFAERRNRPKKGKPGGTPKEIFNRLQRETGQPEPAGGIQRA